MVQLDVGMELDFEHLRFFIHVRSQYRARLTRHSVNVQLTCRIRFSVSETIVARMLSRVSDPGSVEVTPWSLTP